MLPQPSTVQRPFVGFHVFNPVVASRTQARRIHCGSEHSPQQQWSAKYSYLQSWTSKFVQGLPGDAILHSDKTFDISSLINAHSRKFYLHRKCSKSQKYFFKSSSHQQNYRAQKRPVLPPRLTLYLSFFKSYGPHSTKLRAGRKQVTAEISSLKKI